MTELILVRHAQPKGDEADPSLSETGHRQAERVARWLAAERIDVLLSSPLRRAVETAAPIARFTGLEPVVLADLREWVRVPPRPFYSPLDALPDDHPQVRSLVEGRYDDFVPTIDIPAFRAQAARVLDEMFTRWPVERIVAVCHGGIINAMLAELLQLVDRFFFVFPAYTSLTILEKAPEGKVAIRAVNDTGHLVGTRDEGAVRPSVRAG